MLQTYNNKIFTSIWMTTIHPRFWGILGVNVYYVCCHPWGWHWRSSAQGQWSRGPSWSQASMSISRLGWLRQDSPFSGLGLHTGNNSSGGSSRKTNNGSTKLSLLCLFSHSLPILTAQFLLLHTNQKYKAHIRYSGPVSQTLRLVSDKRILPWMRPFSFV